MILTTRFILLMHPLYIILLHCIIFEDSTSHPFKELPYISYWVCVPACSPWRTLWGRRAAPCWTPAAPWPPAPRGSSPTWASWGPTTTPFRSIDLRERKRWVRSDFVRAARFQKMCLGFGREGRRKLESREREISGGLEWNSNVETMDQERLLYPKISLINFLVL